MDKDLVKKRLYATIVDGIILMLVLLFWLIIIYLLQKLLGLYLVSTGAKYVLKMVINFIVLFIILLTTFVYLPSLAQASLGKFIFGLKIDPISGKITFGRILFRTLIKVIFYSTLIGIFIDWFTVFILNRDATHDRLLRTTVIKR